MCNEVERLPDGVYEWRVIRDYIAKDRGVRAEVVDRIIEHNLGHPLEPTMKIYFVNEKEGEGADDEVYQAS